MKKFCYTTLFLFIFLTTHVVAKPNDLLDTVNKTFHTSLKKLESIPYEYLIKDRYKKMKKVKILPKELDQLSLKAKVNSEGNNHHLKFRLNNVKIVDLTVNPFLRTAVNNKTGKKYDLLSQDFIQNFSNEAVDKSDIFHAFEAAKKSTSFFDRISLIKKSHAFLGLEVLIGSAIEGVLKIVTHTVDFVLIKSVQKTYYGVNNMKLRFDSDEYLNEQFCCKLTDAVLELENNNPKQFNQCRTQIIKLTNQLEKISNNKTFKASVRTMKYEKVFSEKLSYLKEELATYDSDALMPITGYQFDDYLDDQLGDLPEKAIDKFSEIMSLCEKDSFEFEYGKGGDLSTISSWSIYWSDPNGGDEIHERPKVEIVNSMACQAKYIAEKQSVDDVLSKAKSEVMCSLKLKGMLESYNQTVQMPASISNESVSNANRELTEKTKTLLKTLKEEREAIQN
tara:strand:- start:17872 stop:19221 length:1350 start_codon:yes stop_codon:yes gene_type:complete